MKLFKIFNRPPPGACSECRGSGLLGRTTMGMEFYCLSCRGSGRVDDEQTPPSAAQAVAS